MLKTVRVWHALRIVQCAHYKILVLNVSPGSYYKETVVYPVAVLASLTSMQPHAFRDVPLATWKTAAGVK